MQKEKSLIQRTVLKKLEPIHALSPDNFEEIARRTYVEELPAGRILYTQNDQIRFRYYLLSGEVTITNTQGETSVLSAANDYSRYPMTSQATAGMKVIAKTNISYICVDNDLLDVLLTWDQSKNYMVKELHQSEEAADEQDWMTKILCSPIFQRIPPTNIQAMFMRMREISVAMGEAIIKQGEPADFYYILQKGSAEVRRCVAETGREVRLAALKPGEGFGEEALLADTPRSATVIMSSDGVLMKLSGVDFNELLKEPAVKKVTLDDALYLQRQGAVLLDVRLETERQIASLPGSINIPLFMLRYKSNTLDTTKKYISYCETGRRSLAAAFLLQERGFEACVVDGGLNKYQKPMAA